MREKYVLCDNNVIISHHFYIDVLLCGLVRLTAILPQLSNYIVNLEFIKYLYSVRVIRVCMPISV